MKIFKSKGFLGILSIFALFFEGFEVDRNNIFEIMI